MARFEYVVSHSLPSLNSLWQTGQLKFFSPVCVIIWLFQMNLLGELFVAHTDKRMVFRQYVFSYEVSDSRTSPKPFSAILADKWFFTSVNLLMTLQIIQCCKRFITLWTNKLFFSDNLVYNSHMRLQVTWLSEALSHIVCNCMVSHQNGTIEYVVSHSVPYLKSFWQTGQLKFFSPVCVIICLFRWTFWVNCLWHTSQTNGFSPVCILIWFIKRELIENPLRQSWQTNGFFPLWIFSWFPSAFNVANVLLHSEQTNCFSPISSCILVFFFMLYMIECHLLSTLLATVWFLTSVDSFVSCQVFRSWEFLGAIFTTEQLFSKWLHQFWWVMPSSGKYTGLTGPQVKQRWRFQENQCFYNLI